MSRSEDERETARVDRERRRAQSRGEEPAPPRAEPPSDPEAPPLAAAPGLPPAPVPEDDVAWAWDQDPEELAAAPQEPAKPKMRSFPSPPPLDWHPDDDPIGTISAPQPGAPGMSPHRPVTVRRRRRRRPVRLVVLGATLTLLLIVLGYFLNATFTPLKGAGDGEVVVTIPGGSSTSQIGDLLAERGVVGSAAFFALRARISGDDLRAGRFTMARGMGNAEAIDALTRTPEPPATIRITLPEGPSRREQAPVVAKAGVRGDYVKASQRSAALNPRDYGAPKNASLEGFLFPATYELRPGASAQRLVREQLEAFEDNLAQVSLRRAKRKNLTRYDVLIIASMIERETALPRERRLVAAVIYNRLKEGIPLGIDATTRYGESNWTRPLTNSELNRDSPYNTRRRQGLPPSPIGNPGLASIKAAADPANVSHLFYVVKACGAGAHNFSRTDAQFQRDVAAYNRKRAQLGGKDPSRC